ncbi:MAG: pyruvate kinase [Candidatus Pacebacteria bacterium]|nr:pyruvate kinase [Candidatus Paceibacterota bacterium]
MVSYKKTKIVGTIGPATENYQNLLRLKKSGLNVCRLNFSHGDHAEQQRKVDNIRKVRKETGRPLAILQDLCGPKIRIGEFSSGKVNLKKGQEFTLTTRKIMGDESKVHVSYKNITTDLKKGDDVLLDDGRISMKVQRVSKTDIICRVNNSRTIGGKRGVNLPGANLKISSLTAKDKKDLDFAVKNQVDYIALSFVRRPEDIKELRSMLKRRRCDAQIISKIETHEAIDNLHAIIDASDGVMVARGDLAIEIPAEKVPLIQKEIIGYCNILGKPVITATQMLESMITSPVPTRAEVSDVANAIIDGTDAVMLSEETTLGKYPIEAVKVMTRVASEVGSNSEVEFAANNGEGDGEVPVSDSITASVVNIAQDVGARLIFAFTESGFTARMISRFRPDANIIAATPNERTFQSLALISGCHPIMVKREKGLDKVMNIVRLHCIKKGLANKGDKVVITAGVPFNDKSIDTNMILVEEI